MATSRLAERGLSDVDLERIRDTLANGKKPKVVFTEAAGQIAGRTGQVVQLTDPAQSDEWLVVRFGHDELPFAPTDLAVASRASTGRKAPPTPPTPTEETPMSTTAAPPATPQQRGADQQAAPAAPAIESKPRTSASKAAKSGRAAKAKSAPTLTVTLAYQDGEWTIGAQQGSRTLAKPYLIKPAEALRMVGMIDAPLVHEAVEQVVAAERAEAEQRAEQLRAQLAQVEAQLAELRDAAADGESSSSG